MSSLPQWIDIPGLSDKTNGLMRQSWALINEAEECDDPDELIDIWDEAVALEKGIHRQREIESNGRRNAQG